MKTGLVPLPVHPLIKITNVDYATLTPIELSIESRFRDFRFDLKLPDPQEIYSDQRRDTVELPLRLSQLHCLLKRLNVN